MSRNPATRGPGRNVTERAIASRATFETSGALYGQTYGDGRFIVYSYREPIGVWRPDATVPGREGKGCWRLATSRFSATTSRHQAIVRYAVLGQPATFTDRIGRNDLRPVAALEVAA